MTDARLMIVDDEPELLSLLRDIFEACGYRCETAANGREALALTATFRPDAILCDVAMPEMNGIELLTQLRGADNHVPFIFLTGHGDKSLAITALKLGAFDFQEKPFDHGALVTAVERALAFGLELRTVEQELDELCANAQMSPDELTAYRAIRRLLLRNRKQMGVLLKKAG